MVSGNLLSDSRSVSCDKYVNSDFLLFHDGNPSILRDLRKAIIIIYPILITEYDIFLKFVAVFCFCFLMYCLTYI